MNGKFFLPVIAASAILFAIGVARLSPPAPRPIATPSSDFSAGRALEILGRILGPELPHPIGSPENARVRDRIREELRRSGYTPETQSVFLCNSMGTCGEVHNVIARLEGRTAGRAILLSAHYDSVPAGPGASDDGTGVAAVLEIARILKSGPPMKNTIAFLLDDGEEAGLLGAEAFASHHPSAAETAVAVNVENRGTSGPSLMFETSEKNEWLIRLLAGALRRPAMSSIFYPIYKSLPNDTDLTVFRAHGMAGINFACVGSAARYHTPRDDREHADPGSLQHHGDNLLEAVRALAASDLSAASSAENAVYFDLFAKKVIWWPIAVAAPMAATAAAVFLFLVVVLLLKQSVGLRQLAWGFGFPIVAVAIGGGLPSALAWILARAGAIGGSFIAHPIPAISGLWLVAIAATWLAAVPFRTSAGPAGLWFGSTAWFAIAGVALAVKAPEASYPFVVPVLAACVAAVPWTIDSSDSRGTPAIAASIPALVGVILWLPLAWRLLDALGFRGAPAILAAVSLGVVPLSALFTAAPPRLRRFVLAAAGVSAAALFAASFLLPAFTRELPQSFDILFHQDAGTGRARWAIAGAERRLPPSTRAAEAFRPRREPLLPWSGGSGVFAAEAPKAEIAGPGFDLRIYLAGRENRRFEGKLHAPPGSGLVQIAFPPGIAISELSIEGFPVSMLSDKALSRNSGWSIYSVWAPRPEGIDIRGVLGGGEPAVVWLLARSPGLPPGSERLLAARPENAAAYQSGDVTIVTTRIKL